MVKTYFPQKLQKQYKRIKNIGKYTEANVENASIRSNSLQCHESAYMLLVYHIEAIGSYI